MRLLVRGAVAAMLVLGLGLLVTAATDEGGIAWSERLARTLPLTPGCAAVGTWVALAPARARGETRALEALGRSRAGVVAAAVIGGALLALVAGLAVGTASSLDASAFYPRAARASAWVWREGRFVDPVQGMRIEGDGAPVRVATDGTGAPQTIPRFGRAAAAFATALTGVALPLLVAHALSAPVVPTKQRRKRLWVGDRPMAVLASGAAVASSVVCFQAAAARQLPALVGIVPPLVLLAWTARRYRALP
jgi:hypothetical protein